MSTLIYGSLLAERLLTKPQDAPRVVTTEEPPGDADKGKIKFWQDALAALVPAEVLAIHVIGLAAAKAYGTSTPVWFFFSLTALTFALSLAATLIKGLMLYRRPATWLGALIAAAAFVAWSMLQPDSAFDSLPYQPSGFARTVVPVLAAVILGVLAGLMAQREQAS